MADLDEIRERLAEREREQAARFAATPRSRQRGRPQSQPTRERLRRIAYERHRARALADPATHPLRRARLTFNGDGLTINALAARALVGASLIQKAERGQAVSGMTLRRLERALNAPLGSLG
jgi:ribosome-binding protein aMBF1 (putative translation factor)